MPPSSSLKLSRPASGCERGVVIGSSWTRGLFSACHFIGWQSGSHLPRPSSLCPVQLLFTAWVRPRPFSHLPLPPAHLRPAAPSSARARSLFGHATATRLVQQPFLLTGHCPSRRILPSPPVHHTGRYRSSPPWSIARRRPVAIYPPSVSVDVRRRPSPAASSSSIGTTDGSPRGVFGVHHLKSRIDDRHSAHIGAVGA